MLSSCAEDWIDTLATCTTAISTGLYSSAQVRSIFFVKWKTPGIFIREKLIFRSSSDPKPITKTNMCSSTRINITTCVTKKPAGSNRSRIGLRNRKLNLNLALELELEQPNLPRLVSYKLIEFLSITVAYTFRSVSQQRIQTVAATLPIPVQRARSKRPESISALMAKRQARKARRNTIIWCLLRGRHHHNSFGR